MGPVYVDLPRDLLNAQDVDVEILEPAAYRPPQRPEGDVERVREAAELLRHAESPAIVVGGGVVWGESGAGGRAARRTTRRANRGVLRA